MVLTDEQKAYIIAKQDSGQKNYYASGPDNIAGLKFRQEPNDVLSEIMMYWAGKFRENGHIRQDERLRLMNDEGIHFFQVYARANINKNNHLSKMSADRRNAQYIPYLKAIIKDIVKNRRRFDIRSKSAILKSIEEPGYQSASRNEDGFEAELSAKMFNVNETIVQENTPQKKPGFFSMLGGNR